MATLMNVNNQAMPMGADSGAGEGATGPKRHFKHIGELVDGGAKVVIMYRTVPGEPNNCLVVGTKFLPDLYHNSLMKAVESEGGQDADEFADFASRQTFPDGTNMLSMLHNDNYIKKFKTKDIMVTYGSDADGRILLNKLNGKTRLLVQQESKFDDFWQMCMYIPARPIDVFVSKNRTAPAAARYGPSQSTSSVRLA